MEITYVFAGLPVRDYDAARAWYERLFGRPPDAEPQAGEGIWRLADTAAVYVVADEARAGSGLVTLAVDDLGGFEIVPGRAPRRAVVEDPDGNMLTLFQT